MLHHPCLKTPEFSRKCPYPRPRSQRPDLGHRTTDLATGRTHTVSIFLVPRPPKAISACTLLTALFLVQTGQMVQSQFSVSTSYYFVFFCIDLVTHYIATKFCNKSLNKDSQQICCCKNCSCLTTIATPSGIIPN